MFKKFPPRTSAVKEKKEFEEEVLQISRVTRVVKGGKRLRFRATVAIGNRKGKVGLGIGKANEVSGAIQKAVAHAKKNLIEVPIFRDTIPHQIQIKYKSAVVFLKPASLGTGIIAGGSVRKVIGLTGIKNVLSKILGSPNRINNARATFIALSELRTRLPAGTAEQVGLEPKAELQKEKLKLASPAAG